MRSMVEKVFVSFKTGSNDPIMDRDLDNDKEVLKKFDADGNTRGSFFTHAINVKVSRHVEICFH
ncbi:hypothetical protein RMATCC62417_04723 [Rhizopus microsporus]|nr:hypothetical protein RMATCC62417_04723 [Rhizopus microsporus]